MQRIAFMVVVAGQQHPEFSRSTWSPSFGWLPTIDDKPKWWINDATYHSSFFLLFPSPTSQINCYDIIPYNSKSSPFCWHSKKLHSILQNPSGCSIVRKGGGHGRALSRGRNPTEPGFVEATLLMYPFLYWKLTLGLIARFFPVTFSDGLSDLHLGD